MDDTTSTKVETAPVAPSNGTSATPAPATDNKSTADVEAARKEAEQARIRANQLENELKAIREKEAEAERKRLEENDEKGKLADSYKAELDQLKAKLEADTRASQLKTATEDILKDYPEAVVTLANTAGLGLADETDEAKTSLKEKLDAFKATVSPGSQTATSSNPSTTSSSSSSNPTVTETNGLGRPRTLGYADEKSPLRDSPDPEKVGAYIRGLSAIDRMKRDAGITNPA